MQIVDIFSGVGGFSLAGKWAGWRTIQFCEINEYCQKVLGYHWPGVPIHNNIKTLTAEQIKSNGLYDPNETTILVGGVPCQPWSTAGQRKGTADDRDLWEESIELAGSLQPDWIVFENVLGLLSWSGGMVFDSLQSDLENQGYEVFPVILPACGVNAPHRRNRIWFIAHSACYGHSNESSKSERTKEEKQIKKQREEWDKVFRQRNGCDIERTGIERTITNSQRIRQQGQGRPEQSSSSKTNGNWKASWSDADGGWPTQSPVCNRNDGFPGELAGITLSKWRQESLKAMGNAIVPQIAFEIFKAIELTDSFSKRGGV